MKQLSFFHPKSYSILLLFLTFFLISAIGFEAQSKTITWSGANGSSGSRWHEASNWSTKSVPTSSDDVVIPDVRNSPVITTNAVCRSITIERKASVTINNGGNLTVSGNWTNNGTFTQNAGTVTFSGDVSVDLGGEANTTFTSLKVSKGSTQSAEVRLNGKGKVEVSSSLSIDNGLLKINSGGNLNLTGTAKVPESGVTLNGGVYTLKDGPITTMGVTKTASVSGNWNSTTTWGGAAVPSADDDVVISDGITVTLISDAQCASVLIDGKTANTYLRIQNYQLSVSGNLTAGSNKSYLTFTSGKLFIGGNLSKLDGLTAGTGTIYFNGINQNIGANTYNNIVLSGSGIKAMTAATTVSGNVTIDQEVILNEGGYQMTLGNNSSITLNGTLDFSDSNGKILTGENQNATLIMGSNGLIRTMDQSGIGPATGASMQNNGTGLWNTTSISISGTIEYYRSTTSTQVITDRDYNNLIISGSNYAKTWTLASDRTINGNFAISTGAICNLSGTQNLNIKGNWTNNGTYSKGTETVTFNGTSAQTISGTSTTEFNNLTLTGSGEKTIASNASVTVNGTLTNNSVLTIASIGALATGSLKVTGTAGSGNYKVQRYLPTDNWHLISSPVSGQTLNNFASNNGIQLDGRTQTYDIGPYNEGTDLWDYAAQSSGFEAAKGYSTEKSLNSAGVVTFTGTGIYTGAQSAGISRAKYGWNCIGNPYTSAISVSGLLNSTNIGQLDQSFASIYIWDNSLTEYKPVTYFGLSDIAVGQGFIVKAKTGGGSISFTKDMQVHQNGATFKDAEIPWPAIILKSKSSDSHSTTMVNFNENMTTGLDPTYDAGMFKTNPNLAIYTKLVGDRLPVDFCVQSLPLNEIDSYRIPVGVDMLSGGEVSFTAEAMNLTGYQVVLEDALTKTLTPLGNEGEGYTTVVPANTTGAGRFYLRISSSLTGTEALAKPEFSVFLRDRNICINGDVSGETVFTLCNIEGKQLARQRAVSGNQNIVNAQSLPAGVYLLRIDEPNHHQVAKVMIAQ